MWDEMLSCGIKCYHVGSNVIKWDEMLSRGMKCYHVGSNVSCENFTDSDDCSHAKNNSFYHFTTKSMKCADFYVNKIGYVSDPE